ncbi:hypothetical protein K435DRAFT_721335 [Dendrothele bispora CBS 962.96]|uniref:SAP domain-containing protein n=1 Tax=Dendrothele bispora (strain CBS 962.96) TaxID=1314807 RepID=A0A4S8M751_DENBC|nr:hypothetical protein K435DRAFT_721335 [Dendrothele bispora CBS 962.96]
MASFSGSLQAKKKSELQSIASALSISDQGTKDDIQGRIKKYLDDNQAQLEEDSRFSGLYGTRRRRGSQPPKDIAPPPSKRSGVPQVEIRATNARRMPLEPVFESTPVKDLRDVSMFLKNPETPDDEAYVESYVETSPTVRQPLSETPETPSSLPPLPESPESPETGALVNRSTFDRSIIDHIPRPQVRGIVQAMKRHEEAVLQSSNEMFINLRAFLSSSRNIWSLTALLELLYILLTVIPWKYWEVPLGSSPAQMSESELELSSPPASSKLYFPYPPLSTFRSTLFWTLLMHWFIPSLLVPSIVGTLISFKPQPPSVSEVIVDDDGEVVEQRSVQQAAPFDPLTASIVRLAAHIAYPYSTYSGQAGARVDVLGFRWRVLGSGVNLAFAFAEAIFNRDMAQAQPRPVSRMFTPPRRALTAEATLAEVD